MASWPSSKNGCEKGAEGTPPSLTFRGMARLGFARPFPSLSPPRGPFSSPRARFLFLSLNLAGRSVALTLPLINITTFITLADNDDHSQWELRAEETYRRAGTNSLSLSLRHLFSPSPLRASLSSSLWRARLHELRSRRLFTFHLPQPFTISLRCQNVETSPGVNLNARISERVRLSS